MKQVHKIIGFNPKTNSYETHIDVPNPILGRVREILGFSRLYMATPICTHIHPSLLVKVSRALEAALNPEFSWFYGIERA